MNSVTVGRFDTQTAANPRSRCFSPIFGSDDDLDRYGDTCKEASRRGHYCVSDNTKIEE